MDLERDERRRPSHIFRFSGRCPPATLGDRDMVRTPTATPNQRPARPARISFGRTAAAPTIQRYVSNVGRAGEGSARLRNYVKQLPGPIVGSAGASTAASHSSKLHIVAAKRPPTGGGQTNTGRDQPTRDDAQGDHLSWEPTFGQNTTMPCATAGPGSGRW